MNADFSWFYLRPIFSRTEQPYNRSQVRVWFVNQDENNLSSFSNCPRIGDGTYPIL